MYIINKKLMDDVIDILHYFDQGLSDIKAKSEEEQPMLPEVKSALKRLRQQKKIREFFTEK